MQGCRRGTGVAGGHRRRFREDRMPNRSRQDQLTKYLTDVHSIEVQALAQLERAPAIARDERLATVFAEHLEETRGHERLIRDQLDARGADTSNLKDIAGRVGGWAMIAF